MTTNKEEVASIFVRTKRKAGNDSSSTLTEEERQIQQAIALSEAEAKLAKLDDEARLKVAIEQSLNGNDRKEETKRMSPNKRKVQEREGSSILADKKPKLDVKKLADSPPILDENSFDEHAERPIEKFEGSLDLLFCKGWIKLQERKALREWMLNELAWHRVTYIQPRSKIRIVTPRFTSTFGKDDLGLPDSTYKFPPKPFPSVLDRLRCILEQKTGERFNAIIINYYADGKDSISYHSDDEAFLGKNPTIASISLGSSRDFYLRRKAPANKDVPQPESWQKMGTKGKGPAATRPTEKMVLEDGDLLIMKGRTQAEWEHSIPKRASYVGGRINMTFRKVVNVSGTNNFIRYNRMGDGDTPQFRWDEKKRQMVPGTGGI